MDKDFQTFEEKYMEENEGEIVSVYDRHAGLVDGAKWGIDHVKKSQEIQHDPESCKENGDSLTCSGSEELEKAAVEAYKKIVEKGGVSFLKIFKAGAEWKENQLMKNAIEGIVLFDYYGSDNLTYGCIEHDSFCLEDRGLKDGDEVKVIIIKEESV